MLIEVCVDRVDQALAAIEAGANRIEMNCALDHDGLTPAAMSCRWLKDNCDVPVVAMLRIHDRGFVYSDAEQKLMREECLELLDSGVDGIVYGSLMPSGEVNESQVREIIELCGDREVVFHRAFDQIDDQLSAMSQLAKLGVSRILTSGGASTAEEGIGRLKQLVEKATDCIEILPGAGVNASNAIRILRETGATQVHGSFRGGMRGEVNVAELRQCVELIQEFQSGSL